MLVAVFADVHAHADALEAVIAAADRRGIDELWSLGDMIGGAPNPDRVVARIRERCTVPLMGAVGGAVDQRPDAPPLHRRDAAQHARRGR